jgi:hypothetical protein
MMAFFSSVPVRSVFLVFASRDSLLLIGAKKSSSSFALARFKGKGNWSLEPA